MAKATRRRPGGAPVGLTRDAILRAANTFDLQDLSMPALASVLGVSHSALYHYFPNKQALVSALAQTALDGVRLDTVDAGDHWRDVVTNAACAMYEVLIAHADYLPHVTASISAAATPISERMLTALISSGCTDEEAVRTTELVFAWTVYYALQNAYEDRYDLHTVEQYQAAIATTSVAPESPLYRMAEIFVGRDRQATFRGHLAAILEGAHVRSGEV